MDGKEDGGDEGPGYPEAGEHPPQEDTFHGVQDKIGGVVAGRVHSPQSPLEPQAARGHRPVIGRLRGAPEAVQAVRRMDQGIRREEGVVIPHESQGPGAPVGEEDTQAKAQGAGQQAFRPRPGDGGGRRRGRAHLRSGGCTVPGWPEARSASARL